MASVVDICNQALSHIGADAVVSAISPPDGSVEAGHCARFYPIARRAAIESHAWNFAKKRVALSVLTPNDSVVWSYAYGLPADCIRPLRVLTSQAVSLAGVDSTSFPFIDNVQLTDALFNEQGSSDFEVESETLRTHEPVAVLLYLRDIEDPTKFTSMFVSAIGFMLASYLAGPIIKGTEGAKTAQTLYNIASQQLARAGAIDANSSAQTHQTVAPWTRARR